jgi:hypothetical protein
MSKYYIMLRLYNLQHLNCKSVPVKFWHMFSVQLFISERITLLELEENLLNTGISHYTLVNHMSNSHF